MTHRALAVPQKWAGKDPSPSAQPSARQAAITLGVALRYLALRRNPPKPRAPAPRAALRIVT